MTNSPVEQLYRTARTHLQAGRQQDAIAILEQLLRDYPNYGPAALMLGALAQESGNLPVSLHWLNRVLAIDPNVAEAYFLMGLSFHQHRQWPRAINAYRQFLAHRPGEGRGLNNLGRSLLDNGQVAEAIQTLQLAIAAAPKTAGAYSNLGEAFRISGDIDAAIAQYQKAISVDERCAEAHGNLGVALAMQNRIPQSIASLQRALEISPRMYNPRFNLARVLQDSGRLDEAYQQIQLAIQSRPNSGEAHNVLGNLLGIMGEVSHCIEWQQRAVELQPTHAANHSNLLLSLQYGNDISPAERFAAHRQWNAQHTAPFTPVRPVNLAVGRRLRIGYVSPNFHTHSVAYFFEPVLAAHDRAAVEIFCYSNTKQTDQATLRLRNLSDHWRDIVGKSDKDVANLIRQDGIDILIDLAGHTSQNRLPVFGFKPAPIQMTWLGYPDTTGMIAMDFRLTDSIADPPGDSDLMHTEKLLRLEGGCWAYTGPTDAPPPADPPSVANGFVTFGSFNNLPKVTPQVLQTWATILKQTPRSRLLIKAAGLTGQIGRDYVSRNLQQHGVAPDRFELLSFAPTTASHLQLYERMDIALDTFPYNGTTTTCEALWMGVPVVTFTGDRHVARVGASLLTHASCAEWIAGDLEGYVALASKWASEPEKLIDLRHQLRDRLKASPLCDATRLARQLEAIYRRTWSALYGSLSCEPKPVSDSQSG